MRVPVDSDGRFMAADTDGIDEWASILRPPLRVIHGIFRIYNPHFHSNTAEDNGLCEIPALFGLDDMVLLQTILRLQRFCLADGSSKTAIEQLNQLSTAHANAPDESRPLATLFVNSGDGCGACHNDTHHPFAEQLSISRHGEMPNWEGAAGSCQVN